ncbi:MAG: hypothetical protein ACRDN6_01670 [Gaiellaceae bacterium]
MELRHPALEHGTSRTGRWLRARRARIALWIAVAEGLLVVFDVIPGSIALLVGAGVIALYLFVGRRLAFDAARQVSWVAALSQVLVALVPVLLFFVSVLAILALAVLALIALFALFADRR